MSNQPGQRQTNHQNLQQTLNDQYEQDVQTQLNILRLTLRAKQDNRNALTAILETHTDNHPPQRTPSVEQPQHLPPPLVSLPKKKSLVTPRPEPPFRTTRGKYVDAWFVDSTGNRPLPNRDVLWIQDAQPVLSFTSKPWRHRDLKKLREAVELENLKKLYSQNRGLGQMGLCRQQALTNVKGLDWEKITKSMFPSRTPLEVFMRWTGNDHPSINRKTWSQNETSRLVALAKDNDGRDWRNIVARLGTNRTAALAFRQYSRILKQKKERSKWTTEEDTALKAAVETYGPTNWAQSSKLLLHRTPEQCWTRWLKSLDPAINRSRWSKREDERLTEAVGKHGVRNWAVVSREVFGRTDVQCRERWTNNLRPELKHGPWTLSEDEKMLQVVEEQGVGNWSRVASELPGRTGAKVKNRYKQLQEKQSTGMLTDEETDTD